MVDELLRLLSSEVLCSAFKHRLPWPKSTPINYNDLQKLQANPDIEGFGRICFPAMKAVSVTKSPEKVDFMQYLPVPEAENFPEQALGLIFVFDQGPRQLLEGADNRWTFGFYDNLMTKFVLQLHA